MTSHTTINTEPDGFSCLTCGLTCENEDTVVATTGPDHQVSAGDLAAWCSGPIDDQAHHFAPTAGGIACQWCALEVTPTTKDWPSACVREQ